jgi:mannitol operon transcriptional antiterminator
MNLDIRNPLLENIKEHYPELLKVSEKCVRIVEGRMGIKIPESEIAYIAMHIGASIENTGILPKHVYRAVIACSAGIGTSTILATRIEKEYDNIQIIDTISTLKLEEEWLREEDIEFIISTVKLEKSALPVVTVNPLLFEEDKSKITDMIKILKNDKKIQLGKKKKSRNFKENLHLLGIYSEGIIQVLDNFFLEEDENSESIKEIIEKISRIIGEREGVDREQRLMEALNDREAKGSIVITGHQSVLFHCRTDAVDKLYFGALKIKNSICCINGRDEEEQIKLGVVMLAPVGCSKYFIEVISYVSKMLIENPNFIYAMNNGDNEEAYNELSNILKEFYKLKVNN